jgi:hypothetical protein
MGIIFTFRAADFSIALFFGLPNHSVDGRRRIPYFGVHIVFTGQ